MVCYHIKIALNLFEERGSELADRFSLKPPKSLSLSSEAMLMACERCEERGGGGGNRERESIIIIIEWIYMYIQ